MNIDPDAYHRRLHELADEIPRGPWHYARSHSDDALIIWSDTGPDSEPLAHAYNADIAKWICATCPALLLGEGA